ASASTLCTSPSASSGVVRGRWTPSSTVRPRAAAYASSPCAPVGSAMASVYHLIIAGDGAQAGQTCRARGDGGRPCLLEDPLPPAPPHPHHLRDDRRLRAPLH